MLAKTLVLVVMGSAFGCSPLPYFFTGNQLPDPVLQTIEEHFKGSSPIAITLDSRFEGYHITKVERGANEKWFRDRAGRIFPIGSLFAIYLDQAQRAAFGPSQGSPHLFKASLTNADMSYTMKYRFQLTYIDWVELKLTITTEDAGGNIQPITLRREVFVTPSEATQTNPEIRDLALRTAIQQLVFDYLDALRRASAAR